MNAGNPKAVYRIPVGTKADVRNGGNAWEPFVTAKHSEFDAPASKNKDGTWVFRVGGWSLRVSAKAVRIRWFCPLFGEWAETHLPAPAVEE